MSMTDLAALRSKVRELLLRYRQDSIALEVAQDQFEQTDAELKVMLERFLAAGGTADDVKAETEWVERNF
jgi:hypothetical protein